MQITAAIRLHAMLRGAAFTLCQMHLTLRARWGSSAAIRTPQQRLWLLASGCILMLSFATVFTFVYQGLLIGTLAWRNVISVSPAIQDCVVNAPPQFHNDHECKLLHNGNANHPNAHDQITAVMRQYGMFPVFGNRGGIAQLFTAAWHSKSAQAMRADFGNANMTYSLASAAGSNLTIEPWLG